MPHETRRPPPTSEWLLPAILAVCIGLGVAAPAWLLDQRSEETRMAALRAETEQVVQALRFELEGHVQYLRLLAEELASGRLDPASFQDRASEFVLDHPGLINVTWADADFIIRYTAPHATNKQVIGLKLSLPEPARASRAAVASGRPVYTGVFSVIQGPAGFEVYVPIRAGERTLGTLGGIYSVQKLLQDMVPRHMLTTVHFEIFAGAESPIAESQHEGAPAHRMGIEYELDPPGNGMRLRASFYRKRSFDTWPLIAIGLAFAAWVFWSGWQLRRRARISIEVQAEATRNAIRLRYIYEAVSAGVILQSAEGPVLHVSGAACHILDRPADEILGRDLAEVLTGAVDEAGEPLPAGMLPGAVALRTGQAVRNRIIGIGLGTGAVPTWLSINAQPVIDIGKAGRPKEVVITLHDVSEHKRLQERLTDLSIRDPLTGLHNRRFLEEQAEASLSRARRYQRPVAAVMIDVDHFKSVNDRFGHETGDRVLQQLAALLRDAVRESDCVARYGGEEMVLLLPETTAHQAQEFAERLRGLIEKHRTPGVDGAQVLVTASLGVAAFPDHGGSWQQVLAAADAALYAAKRQGRNRVETAPTSRARDVS